MNLLWSLFYLKLFSFLVCEALAVLFYALFPHEEQVWLKYFMGVSLCSYAILEMIWGIFAKRKLGVRRIIVSIIACLLFYLFYMVTPDILLNLIKAVWELIHSIFMYIYRGGIITPKASVGKL